MQNRPAIRIFVSSPCDLRKAGDRQQVQDLVDKLSKDASFEHRCALQCLSWDDAQRKVLFVAGQSLQQSVDDRLGTPGDCDIVTGLFCRRLGTPVTRDGKEYPSGTAWELHDALNDPSRPRVILLQRDEPPRTPTDRAQRQAFNAELNRLEDYLEILDEPLNSYPAGRLVETIEPHLRAAIEDCLKVKQPVPVAAGASAGPTALTKRLDRRPYPGLTPYVFDDAPLFFGREQKTAALVRRLGDERKAFTAIIGISGSGKSSLMRAGLLPALSERGWKHVVFRPTDLGRDPRLALAAALQPLVQRTDRPVDLETRWGTAENWSADLETARGAAPGLVLALDQAEELFTAQVDDPGSLLALLTSAAPTACVLLTMRADFMPAALATPPLADLLDSNAIHIGLPPPHMLAAIIREPATRVGLAVEDDLVDALVRDVGNDQGALALLAFTLERLWHLDHATGKLRLATYAATTGLGGLKGALAQHCEVVEAKLDAEKVLGDWRPLLPRLFVRAVQISEDADGNRHAAKQRFTTADDAALAALAERLLGERLLTGADDGSDRVELAHEKLLEAWPALAEWLGAHREALHLRRLVQSEARRWVEQQERDPSYRWTHERVREAAAALRELDDDAMLDEDQRTFLGPIDPAAMLASLEQPETTHAERAFIGERLSVLGDPREGVGVDDAGTPMIRWCDVPGGEVAIEGHEARTIDPCRIAAYPVTVAQYRAFLNAEDGWRNEGWWARDLCRNPRGKDFDMSRFANKPAVHVSWFDAMAFCRWLGYRLNASIVLPDEWQWLRAATGGDPLRAYPWGEDWNAELEPHRANTSESRLDTAIAVGMYPAGASSTSALDMAGNVWEWCLNKLHEPEATASGPKDLDLRALRGGSWFRDQYLAQCSHRDHYSPQEFSDNIGFRVLRSSPIRNGCDHGQLRPCPPCGPRHRPPQGAPPYRAARQRRC